MRISERTGLTAVTSVAVLAIGSVVAMSLLDWGGPLTGPVARAANQPAIHGGRLEYTAAFNAELNRIGQLTPAEFATQHPTPAYLPTFRWDPTSAKFWDEFSLAAPKPPQNKRYEWYDFRANPEELAKFRANGFVVSERMGARSFGEMFYRIYSRDLPVFITSDAILHAWHRSYDAMLEELETTYLSVALADLLGGMADAVPEANVEYTAGLTDADYFVTVARSLLAGQAVATKQNQDARVAETLRAIEAEQMQTFALFGRDREMDFSQFKPRGHYAASEALKRYFRAMMWCGRIDLRVAGGFDATGPLSSVRELQAALVLYDLLQRSGKFDAWQQFDALLQTFVGRADSATFAHMEALLKDAKLSAATALQDATILDSLYDAILAGKFGTQGIRGDVYLNVPGASQPIQMPRSFTVLGQRFAIDSWVLSKVVYDDIRWDGELVQRRVPSGLDVAFAALGSDHVVPDLVDRMTAGPRPFRDRLNYQHNLFATRSVVDRLPAATWDGTVYDCWLGALRELSRPTTDRKFPDAMRTRAWAMKGLNTQLASWTQLRHDTLLYVKQSYTTGMMCYYPAGFVEPVPAFWGKVEAMAARSADLLEKTPYPDASFEQPDPDFRRSKVRLQDIKAKQLAFLRNFARQVGVLKEIAAKQFNRMQLTADENQVLESIVQIHRGSGTPTYNGWYPKLFYKGRQDCGDWDALVADVHTDVPAGLVGDPGCVLHQGVGNIDLLLIAIDNGIDRVVYAGPVLSHYEFEMPSARRKSDSEWEQDVVAGKLPPRPEWTKAYLTPGVNPDARKYMKPRAGK